MEEILHVFAMGFLWNTVKNGIKKTGMLSIDQMVQDMQDMKTRCP